MVSFSSKRNSLFFFEFFDGFLKISSFWNIICPMPWSKKGFVALFQYKIRRVLNTGFTDIHVQDDFRYLFGASGKISLPLAAIFCRVSATLHIHISTWISFFCVPNMFLHVGEECAAIIWNKKKKGWSILKSLKNNDGNKLINF